MIQKIDLNYTKGLFSIYFVYPKDEKPVTITGEYQDVYNYIVKNYPYCIFNRTLWKSKTCIRSSWSSTRNIFINKKKLKDRIVWFVCVFENDQSNCKQLTFRNLPKKWIPDYNLATKKRY